ncbi:hypothetical protein GCM10010300_71370 [Streptomyces olivaceoviridis]|uniref:hypothetical protein n=1 Tax=Streptomyces olivaceoviridis TaxID=1921 RepID=UPI001679C2B4|nr:hypothetical protein [Streptomyces olivaceoviridis]GGZ17173.1 hypothetical protein GCM10010300_71370 [Streptomyces olivaceoviridis]
MCRAGPGRREDASSELLNLLFHQGGWSCPAAPARLPFLLRPAAPARLPFLLRLAARPDVPSRRGLLDLAASPAHGAGRVADRSLDPGRPSAWETALPAHSPCWTIPAPRSGAPQPTWSGPAPAPVSRSCPRRCAAGARRTIR